MELNILGFKMRLEIIFLCMLMGAVIATTSFCSCAGGIKEGFEVSTNLIGAAIDYSMGDGVKASYLSKKEDYDKSETNVKGLGVPLPEGKLSMFGENEMNPNCCPAVYSGSKGCVCSTSEQINFLNVSLKSITLYLRYFLFLS